MTLCDPRNLVERTKQYVLEAGGRGVKIITPASVARRLNCPPTEALTLLLDLQEHEHGLLKIGASVQCPNCGEHTPLKGDAFPELKVFAESVARRPCWSCRCRFPGIQELEVAFAFFFLASAKLAHISSPQPELDQATFPLGDVINNYYGPTTIIGGEARTGDVKTASGGVQTAVSGAGTTTMKQGESHPIADEARAGSAHETRGRTGRMALLVSVALAYISVRGAGCDATIFGETRVGNFLAKINEGVGLRFDLTVLLLAIIIVVWDVSNTVLARRR
jgi:hypothetical protein